ncbi:hypothetical protein, partial [Herbiconiux daphne]
QVIKALQEALLVHKAEIARLNEEESRLVIRMAQPMLSDHARWSLTLTYTECENKITRSREQIRDIYQQIRAEEVKASARLDQ